MTTLDRARSIMGENFLGTDVAEKHFGVTFDAAQKAKLATVPFREATLQTHAGTHFLFAGYPLTIMQIYKLAREYDEGLFFSSPVLGIKMTSDTETPDVPSGYELDREGWEATVVSKEWFAKKSFTHLKLPVRWYLLRETPKTNTLGKSEADQRAVLHAELEVPSAVQVIYGMVLRYLAGDGDQMRPFQTRCRDKLSDQASVAVGYHNQFYIHSYYDEDGHRELGLMPSWLPRMT